VREVEPYYGKYKGILATDNMVQLKRYYGSATGSPEVLQPFPFSIDPIRIFSVLLWVCSAASHSIFTLHAQDCDRPKVPWLLIPAAKEGISRDVQLTSMPLYVCVAYVRTGIKILLP
jgi:hypothetical protein